MEKPNSLLFIFSTWAALRRCLTPLVLVILALYAGLGSLHASYTEPDVTLKVVLGAGTANQPILTLQAGGNTTATLKATALNFTPTSYTWSQVLPAGQNSLAAQAAMTFSATTTSVPQVTVTFPVYGVYQLQVTASNGTSTVTRFTWVNVWDNVSGLNPLHRVGKNPDVLPPTSVRQLSSDPGPYCHPRLFFSRSDWSELSGKATTSTEVSTAITGLRANLTANFDKNGGTLNTYANVLTAYAQGGYDANYYTNSVLPAYTTAGSAIGGGLIGANPQNKFFDALVTASYLAWIGTDPTVPHASVSSTAQARFNYLATLTAAAAKVELTRNGNSQRYCDMALCYDLLYDWMTPQQQNDTRDYLYAIGYGQFNNGGGGMQKTQPAAMPSGRDQNGDFPNLADDIILPGLVIEGEEGDVTGAVQSNYGPTAPYATGPNSWPYASPASVWNLYRQSVWDTDWFLTPWGSMLNHSAYFELSMTYTAPSTLALARRGQNLFVTTNFYQANLHILYQLAPRESDGKMVIYDHHEGGMGNGSSTNNARYILKYMYPDDPMIDYVHRAYRAESGNNLVQAIFGLDTTTQNLTSVAQAKGLSLTKLDPMRGVTMTRNSWDENDLSIYFESRADVEGHMHAEANNFSLYALGRAWSIPPGYHCTVNDCASTVLIQNPSLTSDPATQGYMGQSPSSATQTETSSNFPTPPAKLLEVVEDPAKQWSLCAGDASAAYNYGFNSTLGNTTDTGKKLSSFYYDGVLPFLLPSYQANLATSNLFVNKTFNPVQYAFRSILTVRGVRPYALVLDDISADGVTPRNYRWSMPCAISFGGSDGRFVDSNNNSVFTSLALQSGATATDAVLYHAPIDTSGTGKPRLLVRDVTEQSTTGQPPIVLDKRPSNFAGGNISYGYDNNSLLYSTIPTNNLLIERQNVVQPNYKVLLFPYRTGDTTPTTSWDASKNILSVNLQNGFTDAITLDKTNADHRTRVAAFSRTKSGRTAPTLTLPASLLISCNSTASNGQPGGIGTFVVTAKDDLNNPLTPAVSSPSGTVFPVGINIVKVTATDSLGQVTTGQFTVTVTPGAPTVTVTSVSNLPGSSSGITLNWPAFSGATAYSVKRSTTPGGPYTTISNRQTDNFFTDSNLSGTDYYYVVTAWLDTYEGPNSTEIALAPSTGIFTGQALGIPPQGYGVYQQGSSYSLTSTSGQMGGSDEKCTFLSMPWTGDGSFTARIASVTDLSGTVSPYCNFAVMLRANTSVNGVMAYSSYNPYVSPFNFVYRSTAGGASTSNGPFSYTRVLPPAWLRLVRAGSTLTSSYSYDGINWAQIDAPATMTFPASTLVGFAASGQSNTPATGVFDNVVFLGTPVAVTQPGGNALTWNSSPSLTFSVQRSSNVNGPFTTIASGLSSPTFTDTSTTTSGITFYYTVTTSAALGRATTVSPVISVYRPNPVLAPTGLVLTPGFGQIALSWGAGSTDTSPVYSVQRATSANGPYITVASGLTVASYNDMTVVNGVTYFYRIVADNGLSSATSSVSSSAATTGTFTKANNTNVLNTGASWIPTLIPGPGDTVLWTGTYSSGSTGIGSGISVAQLQMTSPSTGITIDVGTGGLTLGAGGLDLSTSTQNLTINAPVSLAASQTWNINTSRTVTANANVTETAGNTALTKSGAGTLILTGPSNSWTGLTTVSAGVLQIGNGGASNFLPGASVSSSATLKFNTTSSGTLSSPVDGGGALSQSNNVGVITLNQSAGLHGLSGITGVSGGTIVLAGDSTSSTTINSTLNNAGFTVKFNSGSWTLAADGGYGSNLEVNGGTVLRPVGGGNFYNVTSLVIHGGELQCANNYGLRIGNTYGANNNSGVNFTGLQDGGLLNVTGSHVELGSATPNINAGYTLTGGTMSTASGRNLNIGAATTGAGTTTLSLDGSGKLTVGGILQGSQAAPAVQVFSFTGGTLAVAALNATNLRATTGGATGTFQQSGGVLAPGDVGIAGKTAITGAYNLSTSGTLTMDVGGTTQASAFQTGQYDYLTVSGTSTLGGNLSIRLINAFTPASTSTFTILNSTGILSGAFANVAFGSRIFTAGGEGTFLVTKSSNTVTLSGYTANTPIQTWRFLNFGTIANSGNASDTADPDGDGLTNLVEFAYGLNPLVNNSSVITVSSNSITNRGIATVSIVNTNTGVDYRALFGRRKDYLASGLSYTVQFSNDLAIWQNSTATPTLIASDSEIEAVTIPYPFFLINGTKAKFFRVVISIQ